ncbi:MAG: hypothetical protein ACXWL2_00340 [Candidatus Chromulinivorax sp.]
MKKISAVTLFFICNALFVFFEVHKQGRYLQSSYEIQKLQHRLDKLQQQQNKLLHSLYELQQPHNIAKTAKNSMHMQPIELKNIQTIRPTVP